MERKIPVPGEFYRHFKGNIYQIKAIAKHSETQEAMVVYQAMYPPFGTWVRPLNMFMERIDRQKYPDSRAEYRFEQILLDENLDDTKLCDEENQISSQQKCDEENQISSQQNVVEQMEEKKQQSEVTEEELKADILSMHVSDKLQGKMSVEEIAQQGFMAILDAKTNREKRQLMIGLKDYLNARILSNIAVALDFTLEDGSIEEQFDSIVHCLETFEKFEGGRLRR